MANRLQKLALTSYTPGTPYKPAVPAYCVTQDIYHPARTVVVRYQVVTSGGVTYYLPIYETVPAYTEHVTTCYPAVPAQPGVPAQVQYTAVVGWNSGGSSVALLGGNGAFQFRVSSAPFGVVVGLAPGNATTLPNEQTHAFYIHGTHVDIIERGVIVAADVAVHDRDTLYRISRTDGQVVYHFGTGTYQSGLQSAGGQVLDVSLYATGDAVDDPELVAAGAVAGTLPALSGIAGIALYAAAAGSLRAFVGEAAGRGEVAAAGALAPLSGYAADRRYGAAAGTLRALSGDADGGFPEISISTAQGSMAPLSGVAIGLTGEVGSVSALLGALSGYAVDRSPYGAAAGSMGGMTGVAYDRVQFGRRVVSSPLIVGQSYVYSYPQRVTIRSGLLLQSSASGQESTRRTVGSILLLGSSVSGRYDSRAAVRSALLLDSRAFGTTQARGLDYLLQSQPIQLAVNAATGAVSQYVGFDYLQFARCGQELYAVRPDGLYLLGQAPAQGVPWRVDFGASSFGNNSTKFVTDIYFGSETDGSMIVSVDTDAVRRDYRVIQVRRPLMRSRLAKGVRGRIWGVQLEGDDATYLDLDSVGLVINQANRIWAGR